MLLLQYVHRHFARVIRPFYVLTFLFLAFGPQGLASACADEPPSFRIASFSADVTPSAGQPLLADQVPEAKGVADPLFAKGFVLLGADRPIVYCCVDWCEIRNDAYDAWRNALAEAVQTDPVRVLLSSVHQHDAPLADLAAERALREANAQARVIDPNFHSLVVAKVASAARASLANAAPVTHIGIGQAKVERLASNRRYLSDDGKPRHDRMSSTRDAAIRNQPEGVIDPWLKSLSFWHGDRPVVALSSYAVHPMSYYGTGLVSADFPGLARKRRQAETPATLQIYASGCSGNTVAGKYNDGAHANRTALADRLHAGMKTAFAHARKLPLTTVRFRSVPVQFDLRKEDRFTDASLATQLAQTAPAKTQSLAALGKSWKVRVERGIPVDFPVVDFGTAQLLLLPAESYVEHQLYAQQLRPDSFVMVVGYGECGPGYIPTEQAWKEHDANLGSWCWVAPGAEAKIHAALTSLLAKP